IKLSMTSKGILGSKRDYVIYYDNKKVKPDEFVNLKYVVDFVASNDKQTKVPLQSGDVADFYPTKNFQLPVNKELVIQNGTVHENYVDQVVSNVKWTIKKNGLYKNDLLTLDIFANNAWDRPIYFAISVSPSSHLGLSDYFQLEGLTYRLVPYKKRKRQQQTGIVNTAIMYENLINKFKWGGIDKGKIYLNENNLRMTLNLRSNFARLATSLLLEGKKEKAKSVLDTCIKSLPYENIPYNLYMLSFAGLYY
ncbi:MAG: DUF2723 domain-containing protein, partial [Bacteroidetes bacterium]|nr:DUF2723 domain-containing protein [Bacteroidota bacterium]